MSKIKEILNAVDKALEGIFCVEINSLSDDFTDAINAAEEEFGAITTAMHRLNDDITYEYILFDNEKNAKDFMFKYESEESSIFSFPLALLFD